MTTTQHFLWHLTRGFRGRTWVVVSNRPTKQNSSGRLSHLDRPRPDSSATVFTSKRRQPMSAAVLPTPKRLPWLCSSSDFFPIRSCEPNLWWFEWFSYSSVGVWIKRTVRFNIVEILDWLLWMQVRQHIKISRIYGLLGRGYRQIPRKVVGTAWQVVFVPLVCCGRSSIFVPLGPSCFGTSWALFRQWQ